MNETEVKNVILDQKESIKLMRMSKSYQWEIKILGRDLNGFLTEEDEKRLEAIDLRLREKYGALE